VEIGKIKKIKQDAWRFYDAWRKTGSYSPAFKKRIRISLLGWRHITGATGAKKRTFSDTYRRLKLLPYARKIIETSTTIQNITIKGGRKFYALEAMIKVKTDRKVELRKVRVILIEDKKKNEIFYSVMDKKQKVQKRKSGTPHASARMSFKRRGG